jgi:hypothetical protein
MADDGYGNFSGGGSVIWEVGVKDGDNAARNPASGRNYKIGAKDRPTPGGGSDHDAGKFFQIEIDDASSVRQRTVNGKLYLSVPIRNVSPNKPQVRVRWSYDDGDLVTNTGTAI